MSSLDTGERYVAPVSGFSGSNNPIITNGDIDKKIVVIVDDSDMKKGKLSIVSFRRNTEIIIKLSGLLMLR